MAEAWTRYYAGNRVVVDSAGTAPAGIHPNTVWALNEAGIDIAHQSSDGLEDKNLNDFDYVITLCGGARDNCPKLPGGVTTEHWDLPDPAAARGKPLEVLTAFRVVRYEVEKRTQDLLGRLLGN